MNEARTIGAVILDFRRVLPVARILVIDNGSEDSTADIARSHGAEVIAEPQRGKGRAVQRLFREADSEYLIMVDGDDTYPAEEALKLIAIADTMRSDMVVGCRVSDDPQAFRMVHTWANDFLSKFIGAVFGRPCGDLFSGYRLFNQAFYSSIPLLADGFEVETELSLQCMDKGFVQHEVEINFRPRPEGSHSKLHTVRDGFRVLRTIVTIIKDFRPFLFFSILGAVFFLLSLAAGSLPILDYLRYRYIYHVPLAMLATGLAVFWAICVACGVILDTIVRYEREQARVRLRRLRMGAS